MHLPKFRIHGLSSSKGHDIKGIKECKVPLATIEVSWSLDLGDAILGEVNRVIAREKSHRVSGVEQKCVDDHERSFEDPEEPLVAENGRDGGWVDVGEVEAGSGEVFDGAVDSSAADQGRGDVESTQDRFQIVRIYSGLLTPDVKPCGESDE